MGNLNSYASFVHQLSNEVTPHSGFCAVTLSHHDCILLQGAPEGVIEAVCKAVKGEWPEGTVHVLYVRRRNFPRQSRLLLLGTHVLETITGTKSVGESAGIELNPR